MAKLPSLSASDNSNINVTLNMNDKIFSDVSSTMEGLVKTFNDFKSELNNTISGLVQVIQNNNDTVLNNTSETANDILTKIIDQNRIEAAKLSDQKTDQFLEELNKSFDLMTNSFSQSSIRSQSIFNLSLKQITKDTIGSIGDKIGESFKNNSLVKGFTNLKDAFNVLKGSASAVAGMPKRKELTQDEIEQNREKIEREERTNSLLEDILEALTGKEKEKDKDKEKDKEKKGIISRALDSTQDIPIIGDFIKAVREGSFIDAIAAAVTALLSWKALKKLGKLTGIKELIDNFDLFDKKNKNDADKVKKSNSKKRNLQQLFDSFNDFSDSVNKDADKIDKAKKDNKEIFKSGGKLSKLLKVGAVAISVASAVMDGFSAMANSEEWGVSKVSASIGGFLGGDGKGGLINAFGKASEFAAMGAVAGSVIPGIGTIAGGLVGFALGGILGWIGGEDIAKAMDSVGKWFVDKWTAVTESLSKTWEEFVIKPLENMIDSFPSFDNIVKSIEDTIDGIKDYFSNMIDKLNPFKSSEETPAPPPVPGAPESSGQGTPTLPYEAIEPIFSPQQDIREGFNPYIQSPNLLEGVVPPGVMNRTGEIVTGSVPTPMSLTKSLSSNNLSFAPPNSLLTSPENILQSTEETASGFEQTLSAVKNSFLDIFGLNNDKKTKNIAFDLIAREEDSALASGRKKFSEVMDDPGGTGSRSIGYGMNNIKGVPVSEIEKSVNGVYRITKQKADELLKDEIDIFHNELLRQAKKIDGSSIGDIYSEIKDPNKRATILSLAYQVGVPEIKNFVKMWKNINKANQIENSLFPSNSQSYWEAAGQELLLNSEGTGPSKIQNQLQQLQDVRLDKNGQRTYMPTRMDRAERALATGVIQKAEAGYIAHKPTFLLTGEYPNARQNPELTAPINFIKDEMISVTEKIVKTVKDELSVNSSLKQMAMEQRVLSMFEKTNQMNTRLKMKEGMETEKAKLTMPVVNNVVDNKKVTNNSQTLLMKQTAHNPQNVFRLA